MRISPERRPTLAVILAHPDDESFPMGGTLAKYAANGTHVVLICATLGEAGIAGLSPEASAQIRGAELRRAAAELGIAEVHLLGYSDGAVAAVPMQQFVARLVGMLKTIQPQAVITFGADGISGHPDHVAVSAAATAAVDAAGLAARLYYVAPSAATQQGCGVRVLAVERHGPVAVIDVGDYLVAKVRAVQSHVSQDPPFKGDPEEAAGELACSEYFNLARPALTNPVTIDDLYAPILDSQLEWTAPDELTRIASDVSIAL